MSMMVRIPARADGLRDAADQQGGRLQHDVRQPDGDRQGARDRAAEPRSGLFVVPATIVSNGPVLVDVEPVPAPYWSLSVFDARTDVAFVRNNIEANGQPIRIAIALAGQPVPDGMQAVRVRGTQAASR